MQNLSKKLSKIYLIVGVLSLVFFASAAVAGEPEGVVDFGAGTSELGPVGRVHSVVQIYKDSAFADLTTDRDAANLFRLSADTPINPSAIELTVQMGKPVLRIRGTARVIPVRIATLIKSVDGKLNTSYSGIGANVLTYQIIPLTAEGQYTLAEDNLSGNSHIVVSSELLNFAYSHMSMGVLGRFGTALLVTAGIEGRAAPAVGYIQDQDAAALYVGAKIGAEGALEITLPEYDLSLEAKASYNFYPSFQKNIDAQHAAKGALAAKYKINNGFKIFGGGDIEYDRHNLRAYNAEGLPIDTGGGESLYLGGKAGIQF